MLAIVKCSLESVVPERGSNYDDTLSRDRQKMASAVGVNGGDLGEPKPGEPCVARWGDGEEHWPRTPTLLPGRDTRPRGRHGREPAFQTPAVVATVNSPPCGGPAATGNRRRHITPTWPSIRFASGNRPPPTPAVHRGATSASDQCVVAAAPTRRHARTAKCEPTVRIGPPLGCRE